MMHPRRKAVIFAAAILFGAPAAAQVATDAASQESPANKPADHTIWNVIGLFGLAGAFGLWRQSDNDGYTDDPI